MENNDKTTLKSLDRALDILTILAQTPEPLSANELSKLLKVNRTTLYAALNSLCQKKFVEKTEPEAKYTIGSQTYELGMKYKIRQPFMAPAESAAKDLCSEYHFLVNVAILRSPQYATILHSQFPFNISDTDSYRLFSLAQQTIPSYCSGVGKVLLAGLDDSALQSYVDQIEFKQYTDHTICNKEELLKNIKEIQKQGYGTDESEYIDHLFCVAVPIRNYKNETIAAISLSNIHDKYFHENKNELVTKMITVGRQISMQLGWNLL